MRISTIGLLGLLTLPQFLDAADPAAAVAVVPPAVVADASPQLRGLLVMGDERQFSLVAPGRVAPTW